MNKDKVITIDIDEKDDLVCKYSDKTVSSNLIEFLINRIDDYKYTDTVKIVVNKNKDIKFDSIPLIKNGLKKAYKDSLEIANKNNFKQIFLICMGTLLLFLSTKIPNNLLWKQVLIIISWVPIWEAVEIELFPDVVERKRRKYMKKLVSCKITEKVINKKEEVEEVQISQGEDIIKEE